MRVTAKRFVLELLTAADTHQGSVANLVAGADILGVDAGSVRVALARLTAAGTLELAGRGEYRLAATTRALTRQVTSWREVEKQIRRWDGAWACVHLGDVARSDRSGQRRRQRALKLLGFREHGRSMALRPDNLAGGIAKLRDQLVELGLEEPAFVYRASDFDAETERRVQRLFEGDKLSATYRQITARIGGFLLAMDDMSPRAAAKESFLFGSDVLRTIMFDPRLPEPLVDVGARRAMVDAAKRLDAAGRRVWAQMFGMQHGLVVTSEDRHVEYS
ncbi:MAG: PaaX family transcriptional regulator C-terminal domain-containing protein [Kofleriaceae bacterium]